MRKKGYEKRKELYGYSFIGLWLAGTIIFFLIPLVKSFYYSLNDVSIGDGGMSFVWKGLEKYKYVLTVDEYYSDYLGATLTETLWKTPLIIILSLFIAVILNRRFKGRTFARAVFFLPVIIATGPVFNIISGNLSNSGNANADQFSTMFSNNLVGKLMQSLGIYGLSDDMQTYISAISDNIFGIVWNSGIQILIFLAALQNIPASAREAAQIEGATSWEYFWKITFPYVSPFILANMIFTVIDEFTSPTNQVMERIHDMQSDMKYGEAAAMAWTYFAIVLIAVGIITAIINRFIYYETD